MRITKIIKISSKQLNRHCIPQLTVDADGVLLLGRNVELVHVLCTHRQDFLQMELLLAIWLAAETKKSCQSSLFDVHRDDHPF